MSNKTEKQISLNPTQRAILAHAIDHTAGQLVTFPDHIKGGARHKVIDGLFRRALITGKEGDWRVTAEAYDALGRPRRQIKAVTLTFAQRVTLERAIEHHQNKVEWFPTNIRGSARNKLRDSLAQGGLIQHTEFGWYITDAAYVALGMPATFLKPIADTDAAEPAEVDNRAGHGTGPAAAEDAPKRGRDNSKQAQVIAMLRRSEGATIPQICERTGWQAHTVRGTFAGAFKKKLGLTITSDKIEGGDRVYRIA